jgi:hypothetical protein
MDWCCKAFQWSFEEAGKRGFSIIATRDGEGHVRFLLQHRVADLGNELQVKGTGFPVSLVSQSGIQFCPWCGHKLSKWYKNIMDEFMHPELSIFP